MDALVTGGAGFIGSHLTQELLAQGHRVRVLDNFSTGSRENLAELGQMAEVELVEGDIRSYERAHNAVRGCDTVFHLAALPSVPRSIGDPLTSSEVNVGGTLNVLLAARDSGVRRIVYASSSSVYGPGPELPKREDMPASPISPYAVAKLAGEGYCRAFNRVYGLETVSLRFFNVFGPRQDPHSQYAAVIPVFTSALLDRRRPEIFGDGEQSRDFTPVENAVCACVLAAEADDVAGEIYNAACGGRVTVNDVYREIREVLGSDIEPVHAEARAGDILHSHADISRAERDLGYRPSVTFSEGLERAVRDHQRRAGDPREARP